MEAPKVETSTHGTLRIAIVGCLHGLLGQLYAEVEKQDAADGKKTDLVLICGDLQAIRHSSDLAALAVPRKHLQHTGDFYKYYTGEAKIPILTLCIGGNHEASSYMRELYFGGWLCPNLYYLGAAGVVQVCSGDVSLARVLGISGIFKPYAFQERSFAIV